MRDYPIIDTLWNPQRTSKLERTFLLNLNFKIFGTKLIWEGHKKSTSPETLFSSIKNARFKMRESFVKILSATSNSMKLESTKIHVEKLKKWNQLYSGGELRSVKYRQISDLNKVKLISQQWKNRIAKKFPKNQILKHFLLGFFKRRV